MTGIIIGGRYGRAKDNLSIKMYLTLTPIVTGPRPAAVSAADYRLQAGGGGLCSSASPLTLCNTRLRCQESHHVII